MCRARPTAATSADGFRQVGVSTVTYGVHRRLCGRCTCYHHYRHVDRALAQALEECHAVGFGHDEIRDDEIYGLSLQGAQRFFTVISGPDFIAGRYQQTHQ